VVSALQLFWAEASNDTIEILKPYLDAEIYKWQYPARSILDNGGLFRGRATGRFDGEYFSGDLSGRDAEGRKGAGCLEDMPERRCYYAVPRGIRAGDEYEGSIETIARAAAGDWFCWTAMC